MRVSMVRVLAMIGAALTVLLGAAASAKAETLAVRACPAAVADVAVCYGVRDAQGSYVVASVPKTWNQRLVVHAHGGPRMTPPRADDSDEDLERFAAMVRDGYAWVGTSYRRGDYGVRRAAADVETARAIFVAQFGAPHRTVLHGQSWGAQVALKTLELYGRDPSGTRRYDAALLTNGVVAGGVRAYQHRVELRAIYQYYCRNHPLPDEVQYPVWMGLPRGVSMSREEVIARVRECTGVGLEDSARTPAQRERLANILAASGVQERALIAHMSWATIQMRTLIDSVDGGNPFDNSTAVYTGARDAKALNDGVARFSADPRAVALLDYDSKPTGQVTTPVLSVYSRGDAQVSPALQDDLATTFAASGRGDLLAQVGLQWSDHSNLPGDVMVAALSAIEGWVEGGEKPDSALLMSRCTALGIACTSLP